MRIHPCINLAALLSASLFVVACNKPLDAQTSSGAVDLSALSDPRNIVEQFIKYKKYNDENDCYIRIEHDISFCVKIDAAIINNEHGLDYIYAVENGYPLDENNKRADFHAAAGSIKFFKFGLGNDKKLKLTAESDVELCGPFGTTCGGITYKYGKGPELAWRVVTGDMHQGHLHAAMMLYAPVKNKILPVFSMQTDYSNAGAFSDDDPNAVFLNFSSKVTTIPNSGDDFHDVSVLVTGSKIKNKKETAFSHEFTLKFDKNSNKFDTQSIAKALEGFH